MFYGIWIESDNRLNCSLQDLRSNLPSNDNSFSVLGKSVYRTFQILVLQIASYDGFFFWGKWLNPLLAKQSKNLNFGNKIRNVVLWQWNECTFVHFYTDSVTLFVELFLTFARPFQAFIAQSSNNCFDLHSRVFLQWRFELLFYGFNSLH